MANYRNKKFIYWLSLGVCLFSSFTISKELGRVDNWDVDGAHGTLHVYGALTESACRLAMPSTYQTVDLGTTGTGQLQTIGKEGTPIAIKIYLEDCFSSESRNRDPLGNLLWSPDMPAMKIRFLAPANEQNPHLVAVTGATGIGLQLSNINYKPIALGEFSSPQLISQGKNQLTYYVTPVRTSAALIAGMYEALVQFQLNYD